MLNIVSIDLRERASQTSTSQTPLLSSTLLPSLEIDELSRFVLVTSQSCERTTDELIDASTAPSLELDLRVNCCVQCAWFKA